MNQFEIDAELQVQNDKLARLETKIISHAKKHKLWKKKHKTIEDLYATVKEAIRWQEEKDGIVIGTTLGLKFGPRSRNIELNDLFAKREMILEEIADLKVRASVFRENSDTTIQDSNEKKNQNSGKKTKSAKQDNAILGNKSCINPKAIVDNPRDYREVWYEKAAPISKNATTGEYEIHNMRAFVAWLYQENFITEDSKVTEYEDAVNAKWIFENIHCTQSLETIKREIRKCKALSPKKQSEKKRSEK